MQFYSYICLGQHHHQLCVPAVWYGLGHDDVPPAPGIRDSPTDELGETLYCILFLKL